ncbi:MAG: PhzF family phenazine biosynthesis protein [Acidimicrobiales bacterium]
MDGSLFRLTAFTTDPAGGNPAGVWIGEHLPSQEEMQRIAAEIGFSETAFLRRADANEYTVRYFSPEAEVPFCGHATIASGVVLGTEHGTGTYAFETLAGRVSVSVAPTPRGMSAALTSVDTRHEIDPQPLVADVLDAIGWSRHDLDPAIPPARAFAGAWHLVIAAASRDRLARLDYDFDSLRQLMTASDLTTVQLVYRESDVVWHARNPFPVGGVVEDPATGAAAAALGGYLRDSGLEMTPLSFTIHQGVDMGRPSVLEVDVPSVGGVVVSGTAVPL